MRSWHAVLASIMAVTPGKAADPPAGTTDALARAAVAECGRVEDFFDPAPAAVVAVCDRALRSAGPEDAALRRKAHQFRGQALFTAGDAPGAVAAYRAAAAAGCKDAEVLLGLVSAENPLPPGAGPAERARRYEDILTRVLPDKSAAGLYGELAKVAEAAGRADRADDYLRRGRETDPANGWLRECECMVLTARGRAGEAVAVADGFLESDPGSFKAGRLLARKAQALWSSGRHREAVRAALASNKFCRWPGDAGTRVDNFITLSRSYMRLDKPAAALYSANEAIRIFDPAGAAHAARAAALARLGRTGEAAAAAGRAAQCEPTVGSHHVTLGHALASSGRPREALAAYRRASELDPADGRARLGTAVVLVTRNGDGVFDPKAGAALAGQGAARPTVALPAHVWLRVQAVGHFSAGDVAAAVESAERAESAIPGPGSQPGEPREVELKAARGLRDRIKLAAPGTSITLDIWELDGSSR